MQKKIKHIDKSCDTRYTLGNPHWGKKTQPPKASITMYYSEKIPLQYNYWSLQSHSHYQKNPSAQAWIHTSHAMLPHFTNAPLANLSSLVPLDSCLLSSSCHNNYPCSCLYSSKSHKTTKWYYINHVLPNPLTRHLILKI